MLEDNFLQLQAVFDNMTDAIVVADFEAKTLLHNQAAVKLLGAEKKLVSFEDVRDSYEVFSPSGVPISFDQSPMVRAAHGDYCTNAEMVFRRKDGGFPVTTEITTVPLANSLSKSAKIILSIRDVGERVLAEELIRRQKTQLQNVFDNLNEGILLMDMDLNIVQINRAASRLLGIRSATLSRESIVRAFEVLSPNGDPIPQDKWPSALASNGEFLQNREYRLRRNDTGHTILAEISTSPVFDSSGELMQIIYCYRDITRTKKADEERRRLASIVETSEDAIIGKDNKGIVTSWNTGAVKIFGYSADEMVGQSINILVPSDRLKEEENILARINNGEIVNNHFETMRVRKDGHHIHVWLTISPIWDAHGNVIGASKIARDITEKKKLENQLQQSQKMDAVGQLTGGIAHDFNNLLSIVIGNLDLIERNVPDDAAALKFVKTAQKAALRGADLTRRLLAFSSNEALSPVPINLHDLIQNMIQMTDRVIGPEIKISMHFDESIHEILVDSAGFESALVNLMVNARDAMPKGGTITISTKFCNLDDAYPPVQASELKAGRYVCVSVSDTGEGMSRQTLAHVFEPFFTTKPRGKGTGLGLAMVYGFMKQSHGTVRIYSERDYGTTVTLYLPVDDDASSACAEVVEPGTTFTGNATVLVVDDELDLLDIAIAYLDGMGWKAYTAVDGNDALRVIKREKDIDLMVTDIVMPGGMDGVELAHKVRLLNPRIKIIYCSGFPADALAVHNMPLIDEPLLHKPYQRNEFSAMLRRVMPTEDLVHSEGR
jgi:PAS domain S-box-containing protein